MDNIKEIEEMAQIFCGGEERGYTCDCGDWCSGYYIAHQLFNAGYRLCGGDSCPNYKHYQAECERCTKKMEIKKALEINAIKEQAVKEFAEKLRERMELEGYRSNLHNSIINKLVKEICG